MNELPGRRKLWGCLGFAVAVVVLVFLVAPYGIRRYVRSRMSPQQLALVEKSYLPPEVPASWAQVTPIAPDVHKALDLVNVEWKSKPALSGGMKTGTPGKRDMGAISSINTKLAAINTGTEEDWKTARRLVAEDSALIAAVLELGASPNFEVSALDQPWGGVSDGVGFLKIQVAVKLAVTQARLEAKDGDTSRALATATAALGLARRHPASTLISQLIAIAVNQIITRAISDLGAQTSDPATLRAAIATMERMRLQINMPLPENVYLADVLGNLRALKREGYPVDLDFSKPMNYLFDQNVDSMMRYPEWKLAQLQPGDPLRVQYEELLRTRKTQQAPFSIRAALGNTGPFGDVVREVLLSIASPNFTEAATRQKTAEAFYKLTQIGLARRLAELEGNPSPQAVKDLVTKYLPTEPLDPFTSAAFRLNPTTGAFYSVAADLKDNDGTLSYDPTNGTLSAGDIIR